MCPLAGKEGGRLGTMIELVTNMGFAGLYILAWLITWHFLLRGLAARHPDSAWAQGLANLS